MSLQAPFHEECLSTGPVLNGSPYVIHFTGPANAWNSETKLCSFGNMPHGITFIFGKKEPFIIFHCWVESFEVAF